MKLNFKKIKNIFKPKKDRLCIDCSYGWIFLLFFFFLINVFVVFFDLSLFYKIDRGEAFEVDGLEEMGDESFPKINSADLDSIIKDFNLKKDQFDRIKQTKNLGVIDPSQ